MEYRFEVQHRNQRRSTVPTFGLNLTRLLKKDRWTALRTSHGTSPNSKTFYEWILPLDRLWHLPPAPWSGARIRVEQHFTASLATPDLHEEVIFNEVLNSRPLELLANNFLVFVLRCYKTLTHPGINDLIVLTTTPKQKILPSDVTSKYWRWLTAILSILEIFLAQASLNLVNKTQTFQ